MSEYIKTPEREKAVAEAQKKQDRAKELQSQLLALVKTINEEFPRAWFDKKRKLTLEILNGRLSVASYCASTLESQYYDQDRRVKEEEDKKASEAADVERKKVAAKYRDDAVVWLLEKGKKIGTDFTVDTAVAVANELASEEEIARLRQIGGWHEFSGNNCDGPCRGWDGRSHRCECGNRRVYFATTDYHTFKEPSVYGEAY